MSTNNGSKYGALASIKDTDGEEADVPSSTNGRRPSRGSRRGAAFDSWLRSDKSVRFTADDVRVNMSPETEQAAASKGAIDHFGGLLNTLGTSVRHFVGGTMSVEDSTSHSVSEIEDYLGPTDHTVEELLEEKSAEGSQRVSYYSVDRGLCDTPVWHRRKVSLLEMRRKKKTQESNSDTEQRKLLIHQSSSFGSARRGYKYDAKAVRAIETQRNHYDRFVVVVIGVLMACVGFAVSRTADKLLEKKVERSLSFLEDGGSFSSGMAFYVGISTLLALCAFVPVAIRPISAGSGIAEAKATLNGVIVPDCTALTTALCKGLSVICSVAASLPAGLEGVSKVWFGTGVHAMIAFLLLRFRQFLIPFPPAYLNLFSL